MRILLIKPKHIGDSLILTPTIVAIKRAHPDAEIWVVVRRGCEGILAGCPEIDRTLAIAPVEKRDRRASDFWRGLGAMLRLLGARFDYVFELGDGQRARLVAMLTRARRRYSVKPARPLTSFEQRRFSGVSSFDWRTRHRVEKDFYSVSEFLPLAEPIPPLRFDRSRMEPWPAPVALDDFCVVQVGTRQGANRWHREGWREVCRAMLERFGQVVVSCGPAELEREEAAWVARESGPRVISTEGTAAWAQLAWLLARAKLYIGPPTAAMHLAAACSCPVVALFGPTIEDFWRPWGGPCRIVTPRGHVPMENAEEHYAQVKLRETPAIQAGDVIAACGDLMAEVGRRNPSTSSG
jgi:heptosyltransferase-3